MKKILLSLLVFVASGVYVVYQYTGVSAQANTTPALQTSNQATVSTTQQTPQTQPTPGQQNPSQKQNAAPTPAPKPKGPYADGSYTGSAADAYYGLVQVRVTIAGGRLTDVKFLQYPSDRQTSQYINSQAMPLLRQEALQAQSANVSGVSGASDTSAAFHDSLANALAQAKI